MKLLAMFVAFGLTCTGIIGCGSTIRKVDFPPTANSEREIKRLRVDLDQARDAQMDLLAAREIKRAESYLNRAEKSHSLEDLGYGRAYLERAQSIFSKRQATLSAVLRARESAIEAGAKRFDLPSKQMNALDQSVRADGWDLDRSPKARGKLIEDYRAVKVLAVQESFLSQARQRIERAVAEGARLNAPRTLREARSALEDADRAIAVSPDEPKAFANEVIRARRSAAVLTAINLTSRRNAKRTDEQIALELVDKQTRLAQLRHDLRGTEIEVALKSRALKDQRRELNETAERLKQESQLNEALNEVREKFSRDEADVYRDGDRLLIRLKQIDFKTGSAKVPEGSKPLLMKVKSVIAELKPSDVVVEGHADGTGSVKVNKDVSEKRAATVANYLENHTGLAKVETVGYGENRPLRSNKTSEGRATNRRVDVILKPSEATASF